MQVRIGAVPAARAGPGLWPAGIGTRARRPAEPIAIGRGNLLMITGSHVGNRRLPEGIRPLVTRSIPDAEPGRGLGPLPSREWPGCARRTDGARAGT